MEKIEELKIKAHDLFVERELLKQRSSQVEQELMKTENEINKLNKEQIEPEVKND